MREQTPLPFLLLALAVPAQALPSHARLEGQVVDPRHAPVANAEVTVEHDGVVVARTRSDGEGTFVFPKVPAQFVVVRATTDAPDVGGAVVDLWSEHRGFTFVRTMPARVLSGTVRDDAGAPVAGAWVLAARGDSPQLCYATCSAQSDADGRYVLPHAPMGPVLVRAWTDRHDAAAFTGSVDGTADATLDCVVTRDAAEWYSFRLEGATEAQLAAAELHVVATNLARVMPLPPQLARPRPVEPGVWEVVGWTTDDRVHAWVVLEGATTWPFEHVVVEGVGTVKRRFVVGDADGRITGTLLDVKGRPGGGVGLLAQPIGARRAALNSHRRTATSAADGTFVIQAPVDPGDRFALRSTSHRATIAGNDPNPVWFVEKHDGAASWDLRLRPAHAVRVHVVDAGGAPAHGATLELWAATSERNLLLGVGTSNLDGSVEIACLWLEPQQELTLSAHGPGGVKIDPVRPLGAAPDLGQLRLDPAASIRGVVTDSDGNPVVGALVRIHKSVPGVHSSFELVTDRAGRFRLLGLGPGPYWVACSRSDREVVLTGGEELEVALTVDR